MLGSMLGSAYFGKASHLSSRCLGRDLDVGLRV